MLAITFLTCASLYRQYLADVSGSTSIRWTEPLLLKEIIPFLVIATLPGLVKNFKFKRSTLKKVVYVASAFLLISLVVVLIDYFRDINYAGSDSVKFIEADHKTLASVLKHPAFQNKVVYVDMWYSSCSPCIKEFKQLPQIKESLRNASIEYLYLARKTSHPNSMERWKNAIKKYELNGWHIYMSDVLEEDVWKQIEAHTPKSMRSYPHYLIVDRDGTIAFYDALRPSDNEKLVHQITGLNSGGELE